MPLTEEYLKSVSESELRDRNFTPFELQKYDRDSLEEIRKLVKTGKYKDKNMLKEHIDFIEQLANRMSIAITNEKKDGKANWELDTDLIEVRKIYEQLKGIFQSMEQKAVDDSVNKKPQKKRIIIDKKK